MSNAFVNILYMSYTWVPHATPRESLVYLLSFCRKWNTFFHETKVKNSSLLPSLSLITLCGGRKFFQVNSLLSLSMGSGCSQTCNQIQLNLDQSRALSPAPPPSSLRLEPPGWGLGGVCVFNQFPDHPRDWETLGLPWWIDEAWILGWEEIWRKCIYD